MEQELYLDGLAISHEVVETIVCLAVEKLDGVVCVGESKLSSGVNKILHSSSAAHKALEFAVLDKGLAISIRLTVFFGYSFTQLAEEVRSVLASTIRAQLGVELSSVDVFIDHIVIPKQDR